MTEIITTQQQGGEIVTSGERADRNPAAVYLASLKSRDGKRSQRQALDAMAALMSGGAFDCFSFPWHKLEYQHTAALRARLSEIYKPATINKFLVALRRVLKECWRLGLMGVEDYQRAADLSAVNGQTLPAGRAVTSGEKGALMAACMADLSPAGARDAAILALMFCGLRRDEIPHLDRENYNQETGELQIRHAKRGKERNTFLDNGAADALADWLSVRGDEPGPLFWPINKGGKVDRRRMTNQAVYNLLEKRAQLANVKSLSPHDLRRTFVSDLLDAGADIATVAKMAGHSSVQTTARYDRRSDQAKQKTAGLLHIPYTRRQRLA